MRNERFSPQKRQECVAYAMAHPEQSVKKLAQDLGVGYSTLDKWVRQAKLNGQVGVQRQLSPEQARIKALEKEVAHLREVNEIIKKAHVYFVNHPSK
jgi:transposase